MAMEKSEQIHLAITPDRKQEWQEYAEDHPNTNGSLSQLIRLAVEKEFSNPGSQHSDSSEETAERLSEVLTRNREVQSRLDGIEARLGSIERAVQEDPQIQELANEIFAVLPTLDQIEEFNDPTKNTPGWLPEEEGGPLAWSGEVWAIARLVEVDEPQVKEALEKLQSDTARLQTTDRGQYYKEA